VAQNLIANGSFEEMNWCPNDYTQSELKTLKGWNQCNAGTPDHFDACAAGSASGVPKNVFGSQAALDGQAYAGVVLYASSKPNYREYLHAPLARPLEAGEWVCVEWWVCAADMGRLITDGMGFHFSEQPLREVGEGRLDVRAQVENPLLNLLSDRWSWTKLSDAFQARGGEEHVTIGNFRAPHELKVLERRDAPSESSQWAYVYLDDVRITPVDRPEDCSCLNRTIAEAVTDPPWQVYQREHVRWDAVLFDFDSSELSAEALEQLEGVAAEMRANRFLVVEVNGHTDFIGTEAYNLVLSEERAASVMTALKERGVDPARLKLAWHGSRNPAADNATEGGRQQNRRVEFELLEHAFLPQN
jgi:outer membrane protein OmpA-like peptidoglycan-associated protein